jgi:WD40 repeat protein
MEKRDGRWNYRDNVALDPQTGLFNRAPIARSFAVDAKGQIAVSGAVQDGTATLWDLNNNNNKLLRSLSGIHQQHEEIPAVAISPDTSQILTGSTDNSLMLWDTESGKPAWTEPLKFSRNVWAVAFVTNDTAVVGTEKYRSEQPELALWNLATRTTMKSFPGHSDAVYAIAMSPDRKTMLSGSADRSVVLWDIATATILRRFRGHSGPVWAVACDPQNETVLSGSEDKTVRLWDTQEGLELFRFEGHTSNVCSVAYSRDGSTLASGGADGNIMLWKRRTLDELVEWTRKNRYVPDVSPEDGQTVEIMAK